ncbi:MAG: CBS domain-containing protein [Chloroflexi bacterium]|nr:MAG: CBS domain-containing protein [Chloroflexota bacterium]
MLSVKELMTPNPITVSPDTPLSQVMQLMQKDGFRQVPVVEDGELVGIITDRDVRLAVKLSPDQQEHEEQKKKLALLLTKDFMTPGPVTVPVSLPAYRAAEMLRLYKFGALIVVENDEIVGIISVTDFLKSFTMQHQRPSNKPKDQSANNFGFLQSGRNS